MGSTVDDSPSASNEEAPARRPSRELPLGRQPWAPRWVRRLLVAAIVAPAILALVGFFILPPIARRVAESQLGELLGRRVTVGRVRMNPFSLSLAVEQFQIFETDGTTPFFGFSRLYVNVEAASIYRRGPVVREIRLESPRLRIVRAKALPATPPLVPGYNFSDIVARLAPETKEPEPDPGAPPPRFSLNNIRLVDGQVTFEDRPLGSKHQVADLNVGVPFVSTLPLFVDTFVEPGLRVRIDGAPFVVGGRTKPFKDSLETTVELRVANLDLTRFIPYFPVPMKADVTSALLNVGLDVSFVKTRADAPSLTVKGRVALDQVEVRHKTGAPLLSFRALEVVVRKAEITTRRFSVDRVALVGLDVHARRLADGTLDLERVLAPPTARKTAVVKPTKKAARGDEAPRFEVTEVLLKDATLHLRDESVRPPLAVTVDQIALDVRGLSNAPGARARTSLGLRASPGGTLKQEGTLALAPLAAAGTISLDGIEPARFASYYRDQILFDVLGGRLRLGGGYRFEEGPKPADDPKVQLSDAYLELGDLVLHKRGAPPREDFLHLGALDVHGVTVDLGQRTVTVGQIASRDTKLRVARDGAGVIDLTALVPPPKHNVHATVATRSAPWTVKLARLQLDHWGVHFEDGAVEPKTELDLSPLSLLASDFGTVPNTRGKLDLKIGVNKRGRIAVGGTATLDPPAANLHLDLRTIELLPLQPYFADQITLTVTDGTVSIKGDAKLAVPPAPKTGAAPAPQFDFAGDIDLANFATLDGHDREQLIKWKLLHVGGLAFSAAPTRLSIREIALTDFLSRLVLLPDATLNLERVAAAPKSTPKSTAPNTPPAASPPVAAAPSPPVIIGQLILAGGHVSFSDRSIEPSYTTDLTNLAGHISGLSSDASTQADVDLGGTIDNAGALTITGKINPLAKNLFVDLRLDLKDFELPPTSPYAGKYAGYGVSKGKLGLSLDYKIANRRLDAKNRLVIDQFSFGERVESRDATKLPVRLAVALLKDRHGVIDIDLPITGSLEDPNFKVGRAVLKVLGNLIAKAVTAPFSLIASAFGGGDELSHLTFAPGRAALDAKEQVKVRTLARALRERPGLSFEIEGSADPQRDREGLRRASFEHKLRAQKALELVRAGAAVSSPDDLTIDPAERPRLLEKAYKAEAFAKPRNVLGMEKSLPAAEMETLMLANTAVGDDALRTLAQERANAVLGALSRAEPSAVSRLFLVSPRVGAGANGPGHHVELRLR